MTADWRRWTDAERERQVSPSSMIGGNYVPFIDQYRSLSDEALQQASPAAMLDVTVPTSGYPVDVFPSPNKGGLVVVYIHGGYWQELGRSYSRFAGAAVQQAGSGLVVVEYPLAPKAPIDTMVEVCGKAIQWASQELQPEHLVVAGSSAGAHLAASTAALSSAGSALPDLLVLFSGVYDLEPLIGTSVNHALNLTVEQARAWSPLNHAPAQVDTFLCWGEHETEWFKDMNHTYADHLRAYEIEVETFEIPNRNHFDVVLDLCDPASPLWS
jgi:arylformamidase